MSMRDSIFSIIYQFLTRENGNQDYCNDCIYREKDLNNNRININNKNFDLVFVLINDVISDISNTKMMYKQVNYDFVQ